MCMVRKIPPSATQTRRKSKAFWKGMVVQVARALARDGYRGTGVLPMMIAGAWASCPWFRESGVGGAGRVRDYGLETMRLRALDIGFVQLKRRKSGKTKMARREERAELRIKKRRQLCQQERKWNCLAAFPETGNALAWSAPTCRRFGLCDLSQRFGKKRFITKHCGVERPRAKVVTGHCPAPNYVTNRRTSALAKSGGRTYDETMSTKREQYTMGYGSSATAIMGQRTAESHAAFFLPHLKSGMKLLDCGCGPGTITLGLAKTVAPGEAIGTEIEETQVAIARKNAAAQNISNARFETGSIYDLPFADNSFDAAFISAILGNLQDVPKGMRELHRVLKPGGVIGVKEFDHGGDIAYPMDNGIRKYIELYLRMRRENGHDGEAGRKIGVHLSEAGFRDLKLSACYENINGPEVLGGAAQLNVGLLKDGWAQEFI